MNGRARDRKQRKAPLLVSAVLSNKEGPREVAKRCRHSCHGVPPVQGFSQWGVPRVHMDSLLELTFLDPTAGLLNPNIKGKSLGICTANLAPGRCGCRRPARGPHFERIGWAVPFFYREDRSKGREDLRMESQKKPYRAD